MLSGAIAYFGFIIAFTGVALGAFLTFRALKLI